MEEPGPFTKLANRFRRAEAIRNRQRLWGMEPLGRIAFKKLDNVEAIAVHSTVLSHHTNPFAQAKRVRIIRSRNYGDHISLINALPDLTHFEMPITFLPVHNDYPPIRAGHSPHLHELIAPTITASQLVPGQPVERLFLTFPLGGPSWDLTEIMAAAQQSTTRIVALGIFLGYREIGTVEEVLRSTWIYPGDLQELYFRFRLLWSAPIGSLLLALMELLAAMSSLRILDLNGCARPGPGRRKG